MMIDKVKDITIISLICMAFLTGTGEANAINPVRIHDGKKLNFTYEETFTFRKRITEILEPYSIRCNMAMD